MRLLRPTSSLASLLLFAGVAGADDPNPAIELDCLIQPQSSVTVSSAVEGVVEEVLVDRGDFVEKGQVLARLQADVERAAVEIATARAKNLAGEKAASVRLEFANRALDRSHNLQDRDVLSTKEMDEVESAKDLAETEVLEANETRRIAKLEQQRAQAVLDLRTIKSPVKGVVVERILSPGEFADPPQLLELAEIDPLRVEVFAPISYLQQVEVGMTAEVLPEAPVGGSHSATVTVVDRVVDAASGTFGIRLELPNPDFALPAGLNCRVRFPEPRATPLASH